VKWLRLAARDLLPRAAELVMDPWAMIGAVLLSILLVVVLACFLPSARAP
jgi:hypothetical protein